MTTGRFLTATVLGGVTLFIVGFLLWGLAFAGFFEAHAGTATGVMKDPMDFFHLALGQLFAAVLLTVAIGNWAKTSGFGSGLKIGALLGLLISLSMGLTNLGTTNLMDLTAALVDPLLTAVWAGLGGGVIGLVLEKGRSEPAV